MLSQVVYKRSEMGIRNKLLMNWAPPYIILNDLSKSQTDVIFSRFVSLSLVNQERLPSKN